jgi:hypothetical protein
MEEGQNILSPSTEPHADRRVQTWVAAWFPKGSLTTLLSLSQYHAAFSMIPSTLVWVDQSTVSKRIVVNFYEVSPTHMVPPPT